MLTELLGQIKAYDMLCPGDRVYCAVSGGADSMALLWGLYLLREKLGIELQAVHFNHRLRGEESDRDEHFVRSFCQGYEIPLTVGSGHIVPGKKGLEAAARDARYAFFATLPGKIATAHTADDNAETVLMHLVRGTGLKGLGGIAPVNGSLIRPMLGCTRQQVLAFLEEYHIGFVQDSSNETDAFLRNRLRHRVMPLLKEENPKLAENVSAMALRLRQDEEALQRLSRFEEMPTVHALQALSPAVRSRVLERFLKEKGVKEPEREHISLCERLVFSQNPSARARFPGGVEITRNYDRLEACKPGKAFPVTELKPQGATVLEGLTVTCQPATALVNDSHTFTVRPQGRLYLRSREPGDAITLPGGTKQLKKLFIDKKIPAGQRPAIPVLCDEAGILAVGGIGVNWARKATSLPAVTIRLEYT